MESKKNDMKKKFTDRKEEIKSICLIMSTILAIISPIISITLARQSIEYNYEMLNRNISAQGIEHSKDIKIEILKIIKEMYIGKDKKDQILAIELLNSSLKDDFIEIRQVLITSAAPV